MVERIISGGQAGCDQGALVAGRLLGIATGGWAPRGWRTETGSLPALAEYGLNEHASAEYPPRTIANVLLADGTLIFGNEHSPGCRLTLRACRDYGKPVFVLPWLAAHPHTPAVEPFRAWLARNTIRVLNVAGNRESRQPGIAAAVAAFLQAALGPE